MMHCEKIEVTIELLITLYVLLLYHFTDRKGEKGIISDHVLQMKQLTLKDLQTRIRAPYVSLLADSTMNISSHA